MHDYEVIHPICFDFSLRIGRSLKITLFSLSFAFCQFAFSQWSTSIYADSALYVCPGFNQGILTFDDGSSIICGALSDSRYVQKLDSYGYKIWPQPVQVYDTPGTNDDGYAMSMISDGDGGVILWWADFREAEYTQNSEVSVAANNAVFMQRVDKNGLNRWQAGGLQVDSVGGGIKGGYGVTDGQGGIVLYMEEDDYLRMNATNTSHTWIVRYNSNGEKVWQYEIDSATVSNKIGAGRPTKLGNKVLIKTLKGLRFIDSIAGDTLPHPAFVPNGSFITYKDSVAYNLESRPDKIDSLGNRVFVYGVTQISSNWDSVWYSGYEYTDSADDGGYQSVLNNLVPNRFNGLFAAWTYKSKTGVVQSRAQWITQSGQRWGKEGVEIKNHTAYFTFAGENKFGMYFHDADAQLIDSMGNLLWDTNYVVISDPPSAYSPWVGSDNNGGGIITFWSTLGGIYAQHTGRTGKVGVITKVLTKENVPLEFELSQNFPNPFNPSTTIRFSISHNAKVTLKIFDILGREVAALVNRNLEQGRYEVVWRAGSNASGVYCYVLQMNNAVLNKKMILLK